MATDDESKALQHAQQNLAATESSGSAPPDETIVLSDETSRGPSNPPSKMIDSPASWIGKRIGKYQITGVLGSGGMGVVYEAHDLVIERDVALKVLPREFSENETVRRRFHSEAKAAGRLNHPNTVSIYEIDSDGDVHYLAMEYVTGGSVADRLQLQGRLSVIEATRIAADACRGLAAAHAVGLVHRDIKPGNLLMMNDGTIKVADFGLAKFGRDTSQGITQTGQVVGTPYFMSPEQCQSTTLDHRSDIYSLGATYYTLLTSLNPYHTVGSSMQVMFAHCHGDVLDPRKVEPTIPAACAAIVAKATAKDPNDRYQTAEEMLADLNAVVATMSGTASIALPSQSAETGLFPVPRSNARRAARFAMASTAALLLVGGIVGWWIWSVDHSSVNRSQRAAASAPLAPAVGQPVARVGVLHSLSGTMADSASAVADATLLAIEELNRDGGVLGHRIEPVVRDGRSQPEYFAHQAEDLLADDTIDTIFGCWTSSTRKTVVPMFEKYDALLFYPVQYEGLEESPNVFYFGATPNQQLIPALKWAYAFQNKRRFFLVGSDYVYPRTANEIAKDVLSELGAEVVGEAYLPMGSHEVNQVVADIVAARPDMIVNTINGDANTTFFKHLRDAGLTPQDVSTISCSVSEEELRHLDVDRMVGDFAAWNYFESIDSPENRKFVDAFHQKYGPQRVITDPMEAAYMSVKLWAQAVEEAQSFKAADIRRAMRNQHRTGPGGVWQIDPQTQHAFKTPRVGRINPQGQFDVVWTSAQPEQPVPYPPSRSRAQWTDLLNSLYRGWDDHWSAPGE